jgi:hypothetical protein
MLREGRLIESVSIQKCEIEADDDWAVFEFGLPDPAVSAFRVPGKCAAAHDKGVTCETPNFDEFFQCASLLVLAATVYVSYRQAKAADKMARLSLQQTELTRAQLHASFTPIVEVTGGEYGANCAMLTLQNVGNSPALTLTAICRNAHRDTLGTLPRT